MPRPLPDRFIPDGFGGLRAKHFPRREDKFQQFIGDALLALCAGRAHVVPTRGQDGSIDAYVDGGSSAFEAHFGLPTPTIVEAKDHDDTVGAGNLQRNIRNTWGTVAAKLRGQAESGWTGLFAPWRHVRGYLYCVSAVLPNQQERSDLEGQIRVFFRSLPEAQRPPIEAVKVVDWIDIRALGRQFATLLDDWMGSGVSTIRTLAEHEATLDRFLAYLREDKLPFVSPSRQFEFHPERLLGALDERRSASGIVLLGAGGVGKTRTALEVGRLARARGDRVVWVNPGEPAVTATQLGQAVGAASGDVLLILDYAEQMGDLDWSVLRRDVLPSMRTQGSRIAVFANARSAWIARRDPERDSFFHHLHLSPTDEHRADIQRSVVTRAASTAVAQWGADAVRSICGERPIIALLIALELERLARREELVHLNSASLRGGDLLHWLKRRLTEDEIGVGPPESVFRRAEPTSEIVLVAGLVALAPLNRGHLESAGRCILDVAPGSADPVVHVMTRLEEMGWLEARQDLLATPHDVVADQILEDVIFDGMAVRSSHLRQIFMAANVHARNFGRLAISLDRLIGSLQPNRTGALRSAVGNLLVESSAAVRGALFTATPDASSYALAAAVSSTAFDEATSSIWAELVVPWLEQYGNRQEARHLLHRGLRAVPRDHAVRLINAANAWLASFGATPEAGFVLAPLLGRDDLTEDIATATVAKALAWLDLFEGALEAQFVLAPLLGRDDLTEDAATVAIAKTLAWLAPFGTTSEAGFVFPQLLSRDDLTKDVATAAVAKVLAWLDPFGGALEAQFVLAPLLDRDDLAKDAVTTAVAKAFAWLGPFGTSSRARFVLASLLGRDDLTEDDTTTAIAKVFAWLGPFGTSSEAGFVLAPLLGRHDLTQEAATAAIAKAFAWLGPFGDAPTAQFVLSPLLGRDDLTEDDATAAIARALAWLDPFGVEPEAQFVLDPLLGRDDLTGDDATAAIAKALAWLAPFGATSKAGFVLAPLLGRDDLTEDDATTAIGKALAWLGPFGSTQEAESVFNPLLSREDISDADFAGVANAAIDRLDAVTNAPDATFILQTCLRAGRRLDGATARAVEQRALSWLREFPGDANADYVFNPFLRSKTVDDDTWKNVAELAMRWLQLPRSPSARSRAFNSLLMRYRLHSPAQRDSILADAIGLLRGTQPEFRDAYLLESLIRIGSPLVNLDELRHLQTETEARRSVLPFKRLSEELRAIALKPGLASADPAFVLDACRKVEQRSRRSPSSAAYAIGPLVAIAVTMPALLPRVIEVARAVLSDGRLAKSSHGRVINDLLGLANLRGDVEATALRGLLDKLGLGEAKSND